MNFQFIITLLLFINLYTSGNADQEVDLGKEVHPVIKKTKQYADKAVNSILQEINHKTILTDESYYTGENTNKGGSLSVGSVKIGNIGFSPEEPQKADTTKSRKRTYSNSAGSFKFLQDYLSRRKLRRKKLPKQYAAIANTDENINYGGKQHTGDIIIDDEIMQDGISSYVPQNVNSQSGKVNGVLSKENTHYMYNTGGNVNYGGLQKTGSISIGNEDDAESKRKAKIFGKGKNGSTTPKEEYINTGGLVNDSEGFQKSDDITINNERAGINSSRRSQMSSMKSGSQSPPRKYPRINVGENINEGGIQKSGRVKIGNHILHKGTWDDSSQNSEQQEKLKRIPQYNTGYNVNGSGTQVSGDIEIGQRRPLWRSWFSF